MLSAVKSSGIWRRSKKNKPCDQLIVTRNAHFQGCTRVEHRNKRKLSSVWQRIFVFWICLTMANNPKSRPQVEHVQSSQQRIIERQTQNKQVRKRFLRLSDGTFGTGARGQCDGEHADMGDTYVSGEQQPVRAVERGWVLRDISLWSLFLPLNQPQTTETGGNATRFKCWSDKGKEIGYAETFGMFRRVLHLLLHPWKASPSVIYVIHDALNQNSHIQSANTTLNTCWVCSEATAPSFNYNLSHLGGW